MVLYTNFDNYKINSSMHLSISEGSSVSTTTVDEKLVDICELLDRTCAQGRLAGAEVSLIKELIEEQSAVIDVLRAENIRMIDSAPGLQPIQEEFLIYKRDAQDTILSLESQLNDLRLKVNDLDKKLLQFGIDVVHAETAKADAIMGVNAKWEEKVNLSNTQSKRIIEEIVKKHCDVRKGYETVIHGLKEQIAHKEAEVAWGQLIMKEKNTSIDKEIANLKKELEVTSLKNQELLQIRLSEVERRANKMTKKCLKLQQDYEQKITNLKKEKDLQIKTLQNYSKLEAEKENAETGTLNLVESAVQQLEEKYKKIIISLHTASKRQRTEDMKRIATLECLLAGQQSGVYK